MYCFFIVPHVDIELEDNTQFISNIPRILKHSKEYSLFFCEYSEPTKKGCIFCCFAVVFYTVWLDPIMCKIIRTHLHKLSINHLFWWSLNHFFQIFQLRNFMNSCTCWSIISFEGEISCFFNNNCNFLLQSWLRPFACFPVLPDPNLFVLLQDLIHQFYKLLF